MAKRKTPKVKDLRPEKINNEQLNKVQSVINEINRSQLEIGSMESRKHSLLHGIARSQEELQEMQKEFEKDYGTSNINIKDGTINYNEDVKTD